jgi:hypothetical protein
MQKKKPSFQAIPNWRVSVLTNWNESKEVPAEQGRNDPGLHDFSDRPALLSRLIAAASTPRAAGSAPLEMTTVIRAVNAGWGKWCVAIDFYCRNLGRDTAAPFIEHSNEI